jgi:hypothetical protein
VDRRKQPQTDTKMRAEDTIRLNFRRSEHRLAAIFTLLTASVAPACA